MLSQVKLRDARAMRLLSMKDLADRADVSKAAIFKIEAGKVERPRPKLVRAVCAALDMKPEEIDEFLPTLKPLIRQKPD